jgi:hypothetical protein
MTIYVEAVTLILTEVEGLLDTPSALEAVESKRVVYCTGLNGAFRRYIYGGREGESRRLLQRRGEGRNACKPQRRGNRKR